MFKKTGYFGSIWSADKSARRTLNDMLHDRGGQFVVSVPADNPKLYVSADVIVDRKTFRSDRVLFDTGAFVSGISKDILPAVPTGIMSVATAYGVGSGAMDTFTFPACISLPGGIEFNGIDLWILDIPERIADVIIGMDLISRGDLTLKRDGEAIVFTFQV